MMTRFVLTLLIGLVVSLGALVSGGSGVALASNWSTTNNKKQSVNVAFFLEWATPNQIAKVEKLYDQAMGVKVNWTDFRTGVEMTRAMLAGDVDIAYSQGFSPFITAKMQGAPIEMAGIAVLYPANHCFVRSGLKISANNSNGKRVAVPLQTMADYSFRLQMEALGINISKMRIIDMAPSDGAEALKNGNVDMACIFGGNSSKLAASAGQPIMSFRQRRKNNIHSFDVISVTKKFADNHPQLLRKFLEVTNKANRHWKGTRQQIQVVAKDAGMSFEDTKGQMSTFLFPTVEKQRNEFFGQSGFVARGAEMLTGKTGNKVEKLFSSVFSAKHLQGLEETSTTQIASSTSKTSNTPSSAELNASQREAERLRQELAALKAQQQQRQQTIANDTQVPLITITQSGADGRKGSVKGFAKDNVQVAEVLIDGKVVRVGNDGSFEWSGFVPSTGKEITIEAIDTAALSSTKTVSLKRGQIQQASGPRFDVLDPTAGKKVKRNSNALALIVGISDYERTDAPAVYADKDAQYFHDYASLKLGIPDSNIKTMVNAKAEQGDVILAVKDWIRRLSRPGNTDVYVFFAGHGLASDDGEQMYLLPYDGRPRLLDKTAILREELFDDIASANPRSVTVFLDTCYSGTTRGTDMLIASRPIAIKALEQSVPDNFTVMTAAAGDQTAKPLEEAKHGMFSYFLMKGMEGEADSNQDNKITAGELHSYVQSNVVQQSSGSQTPELQGDANRVLVQFQ